MRSTSAILAVLGLAIPASAQTTTNAFAVQTSTIQPGGPRIGVNNDRFMNIEGTNNTNFASYGVARWDVTAARAAFDTAYGAGHWHITSVELELSQSNAAFSLSGGVSVYYSTDDTTDVKANPSPTGLAHPFFDLSTSAPDLTLGNSGNPVLSYTYMNVGATFGTIDRYTQTGSQQNTGSGFVPLSPAEILSLAPDMVADLTSDNTLTLVFVDTTAAVAATYRGQEPLGTTLQPNLYITAIANGPAPCYANCDLSTTLPVLNVLDFSCFLNKFAAADTYANCDQSTTAPTLNVLDFSCFLNKFAAGCT